jgi:hypothetical protein
MKASGETHEQQHEQRRDHFTGQPTCQKRIRDG